MRSVDGLAMYGRMKASPFADSGWPGAEDAERREPARLAGSGGKPAWPALHHRRQLITY